MSRRTTPRTAGAPAKQGTPAQQATPAQSGAPDVIAEELTSKLTSLEDKLRKELLGLGNEPPQRAFGNDPTQRRATSAAPATRAPPYSTSRAVPPTRGSNASTSRAPPPSTPAAMLSLPPPPADTPHVQGSDGASGARLALKAMQRHRTDLQHERSALAWLLQSQQRTAGELRSGLEVLLTQMRTAQAADERRHAQALLDVRAEARRSAQAEHASAQATLLRAHEERGEAMLRAEQLSVEAARLREMVGQLKRHDDEMYASQSGSAAEITQLRASLAAAEERVAAGRIALDEESTRRLEAERRVEIARSERQELLARGEGKAEAESQLAALQAGHAAALAQSKEDHTVLVGEVRRLGASLDVANKQLRLLEESGAATTEQLTSAQAQTANEAHVRIAAAADEADAAREVAERHRREAERAVTAAKALKADLLDAANADDEDEAAHLAAIASAGEGGADGVEGGATDAPAKRGHTSTKLVPAAERAETGGEAIRLLVGQRTKLRTALRSAAEQVQLATRKLSRANARSTLLAAQLKEAGERADLADAKARAADSARSRDEATLASEREARAAVERQLEEEHSRVASLERGRLEPVPAAASAPPPSEVFVEESASNGGDGGGEMAAALAAASYEAACERCSQVILLRELAMTEADLFTAWGHLEAMEADETGRVLAPTQQQIEHDPRAAQERAKARLRAARQARRSPAGGGHGGHGGRRVAFARENARAGDDEEYMEEEEEEEVGAAATSSGGIAFVAGGDGHVGSAGGVGTPMRGGGTPRRTSIITAATTATTTTTAGAADIGADYGKMRPVSETHRRVLAEQRQVERRAQQDASREEDLQAARRRAAREYAERVRSLASASRGGGGGSVARQGTPTRPPSAPSDGGGGLAVTARREASHAHAVGSHAQAQEEAREAQHAAERAVAALERAAAEKVAAERAAARASEKTSEKERMVVQLVDELEAAKTAAERAENDATRLRVQLAEAKRQLTQAFATTDSSRKQLSREGDRVRESDARYRELAVEREQLVEALREAERAVETSDAIAEEAKASALEQQAAAELARQLGEANALRAMAAQEAVEEAVAKVADAQGRMSVAEEEAGRLRVELSRIADEQRHFALLEAQCTSAQTAANSAEEQALAAAARVAKAALETRAVGATLAVEIRVLDLEILTHDATVERMHGEAEELAAKANDLERALQDAEARVLAAEQRADEGAISWREQLLSQRETHAAALQQERSDGKREWKARLQALQGELKQEMHALQAMPSLTPLAPPMPGSQLLAYEADARLREHPPLHHHRQAHHDAPPAQPPPPVRGAASLRLPAGAFHVLERGDHLYHSVDDMMPPPATRPSTRRTAFERAGPGDHADEDEGGMGGEAPSPDWETALEAAAAQHMEAAMGGAAPSRGDTPGAGAGSTYLSAEESAAALERKLRAIQTATAREQPALLAPSAAPYEHEHGRRSPAAAAAAANSARDSLSHKRDALGDRLGAVQANMDEHRSRMRGLRSQAAAAATSSAPSSPDRERPQRPGGRP